MAEHDAGDELDEVHTDWERLGRESSMWGILTKGARRDDAWDVEEFLASGRPDVELTMRMLANHQLPKKTERALDFGCGIGRVTQAFAPYFDAVVGVDIAASMVEQARGIDRSGGRVTYVQNTAPDLLRFDDESFDLVYSKIVLQHMPPALSGPFLSELARLVAPGGGLVVQIPSEQTGMRRLDAAAYRATVEDARAPTTIRAGDRLDVQATIRNASDVEWRGSEAMLAIGAYWRDSNGARLALDEGRSWLDDDVAPSDTRSTRDLALAAPLRPGRYRLVVDVVHEGVTWFGDEGNDGSQEIIVDVTART